MTDILLAKPNLPPGFIDVSVGEPHVVRDNLLNHFHFNTNYLVPQVDRMYEYPPPTGYSPLVEFLEKKHGAPVIITNGAKQALGASFYALKKMGKTSIGMRVPYWALIPPLVEMHGLNCEVCNPKKKMDSLLLLAPNNPDGFIPSSSILKDMSALASPNYPLIHDAAYYTHVYLPPNYDLVQVGDVQIYSISKMLGLSGLRLGYVVCYNPEFYPYIQEYMEAMTVGVSVMPQIFLLDLLKTMEEKKDITESFECASRNALRNAKEIMQEVDSEILEIPDNLTEIPGMFGWFKVGPACDFTKAKINAIDGALFGQPGMVRMNLAFNTYRMKEIVRRLNLVKR
jgi:aspartate/methionine/tyrosine aminotransferase